MSSNALRISQILHLSMLALLPILFAIFRMVSEPYDPSRALIENLVLIGGSMLTAYTLVFFVVTGKSEDALPNLYMLYRKALTRGSFIIVSNIILMVLLVLLIHQLTFYRQVEFLSPTDVEIYLGDETGEPERLGFVRARNPAYFRLSIGDHLISVKKVGTQQFVEAQSLKVPSVISKIGLVNTWINPRKGQYERLN